MVKICKSCLNMFEGNIAIDHCPIKECYGCKLIEIEDMLATAIIRFWSMNISTASCCLGHLYSFHFSPYVIFDAPQDDEGHEALTFLRNLFMDFNEAKNLVEIRKIVFFRGKYSFVVESKKCDDNIILRLEVQSDFLRFLYEVSESIRAKFLEDMVFPVPRERFLLVE